MSARYLKPLSFEMIGYVARDNENVNIARVANSFIFLKIFNKI